MTTRTPESINSVLTIVIDAGTIKDIVVEGTSLTNEEVQAALNLGQQVYEKQILEEALEH